MASLDEQRKEAGRGATVRDSFQDRIRRPYSREAP